MKASELIDELNKLIKIHGDRHVASTGPGVVCNVTSDRYYTMNDNLDKIKKENVWFDINSE